MAVRRKMEETWTLSALMKYGKALIQRNFVEEKCFNYSSLTFMYVPLGIILRRACGHMETGTSEYNYL